jgi:hypothetical protein
MSMTDSSPRPARTGPRIGCAGRPEPTPEELGRVLAGVTELQCERRPGTTRELVRITAMEPPVVSEALARLVASGTVARTDSGGTSQYRLATERWPFT